MLSNLDKEQRLKRIQALSRLDDLNPLWLELKSLLDEELHYALDLAMRCEIHGEDAAWNRGYASAIRNVLDTLNEYRNANRSLESPGL